MLSGFPIYLYFKNGNTFSGEENGMRYLIAPGKCVGGQTAQGNEENNLNTAEQPCLTVTLWPGPWSLEHTAPQKQQSRTFSGDQQGLDAAAAWLREQYAAQAEKWNHIPSILDCEPDLP